MITVTICDDDLFSLEFAEKSVKSNRRMMLTEKFTRHIDLLKALKEGYRSDLYIIDCLFHGEQRNWGYEFVKEISRIQPEALIIVCSQLNTAPLRRDLVNYRIQAIMNKSADEDESSTWRHLLPKALIALGRGYRCDNPAIDVHEMLEVVDTEKVNSLCEERDLTAEDKEVLSAMLQTWHTQEAGELIGISRVSYRVKLLKLCEKLNIDSQTPIKSCWDFSVKKKLWNPGRFLDQRNISLSAVSDLSETDVSILKLLLADHDHEQISAELKMSKSNVYSRIKSIKEVAGASTLVDLWALTYMLY